MRLIVSAFCLLFIGVAGCNPAEEVRKMREKERQMQEDNMERQVKEAMDNFNTKYEGLDDAEEKGSESSKP